LRLERVALDLSHSKTNVKRRCIGEHPRILQDFCLIVLLSGRSYITLAMLSSSDHRPLISPTVPSPLLCLHSGT
jgi:hypothetical protein